MQILIWVISRKQPVLMRALGENASVAWTAAMEAPSPFREAHNWAGQTLITGQGECRMIG
jgi:hypothetical protein